MYVRGGRVLVKGCQFPYIKILNVVGISNKIKFWAFGGFSDNLGN